MLWTKEEEKAFRAAKKEHMWEDCIFAFALALGTFVTGVGIAAIAVRIWQFCS